MSEIVVDSRVLLMRSYLREKEGPRFEMFEDILNIGLIGWKIKYFTGKSECISGSNRAQTRVSRPENTQFGDNSET